MILPSPRFPDPAAAPALRWGVLAPGGIARDFTAALHRHTTQRVVAVASRSADRAESFARELGVDRAYAGYERLVADPGVDVVYVAATHNAHEALALLAIAAGKPVLVEKPLATTAASAQRIADAAHAAGVFAMEAMWTRYLPQLDVARQLLDAGELGEVRLVTADMGFRADVGPQHRLLDPAQAGGALLDVGVYLVSFAQFALPALSESAAVHAFGSLAATGVDAQVSLVLETDASAQALLSATLLADTPQTATISGESGRIEIAGPFWSPSDLLVTAGGDSAVYRAPAGIRHRDGMAFEAAAVARQLSDGLIESPLHPLAESVAALHIIDRARRAVGYPLGLEQ